MYKKGPEHLPEPYRTLTLKLLRALLGVFRDKLWSLVVYGSVARGDYKRDSDIDLLLVIEDLPKSRLERVKLFLKAEEKLDEELDRLLGEGYAVTFSPVIKTPEEAEKVSPLYLDMVEDAIIVYDKKGFFERVLLKLKKRLKELNAERVKLGKKWYWRLKRDYKFGEVITLG